jgi:hypothetical protein
MNLVEYHVLDAKLVEKLSEGIVSQNLESWTKLFKFDLAVQKV